MASSNPTHDRSPAQGWIAAPGERSPRIQREMALSRWENEGGAIAPPWHDGVTAGNPWAHDPPATGTEWARLRVRVIALENLVLSLLAVSSDEQLALAADMAGHISPRPGFTPHPMTLHAATQMRSLLARSEHFRFCSR